MRATAVTGTSIGTDRAHSTETVHRNLRRRAKRGAKEAAMPLIYLPLIMYTSWMEMMLRPLRHDADRCVRAIEAKTLVDRRTPV